MEKGSISHSHAVLLERLALYDRCIDSLEAELAQLEAGQLDHCLETIGSYFVLPEFHDVHVDIEFGPQLLWYKNQSSVETANSHQNSRIDFEATSSVVQPAMADVIDISVDDEFPIDIKISNSVDYTQKHGFSHGKETITTDVSSPSVGDLHGDQTPAAAGKVGSVDESNKTLIIVQTSDESRDTPQQISKKRYPGRPPQVTSVNTHQQAQSSPLAAASKNKSHNKEEAAGVVLITAVDNAEEPLVAVAVSDITAVNNKKAEAPAPLKQYRVGRGSLTTTLSSPPPDAPSSDVRRSKRAKI